MSETLIDTLLCKRERASEWTDQKDQTDMPPANMPPAANPVAALRALVPNMKPDVRKLLKGMAAVAGFTTVGLVGVTVSRKLRTVDPLPHVDGEDADVAEAAANHKAFENPLRRLSEFARFSPASFADAVRGCGCMALVEAQVASKEGVRFSLSRQVAEHAAVAIEGTRRLRAYTKLRAGSMAGVMQDFDDAAGDLQKAIDGTKFNVSMKVSSLLA